MNTITRVLVVSSVAGISLGAILSCARREPPRHVEALPGSGMSIRDAVGNAGVVFAAQASSAPVRKKADQDAVSYQQTVKVSAILHALPADIDTIDITYSVRRRGSQPERPLRQGEGVYVMLHDLHGAAVKTHIQRQLKVGTDDAQAGALDGIQALLVTPPQLPHIARIDQFDVVIGTRPVAARPQGQPAHPKLHQL